MVKQSKPEAAAPLLLTIKDAARLCSVSTRTICRWADDNRIKSTSAFGRRKIVRSSILETMGEAA
jgi:excisionase family DNA binding protein